MDHPEQFVVTQRANSFMQFVCFEFHRQSSFLITETPQLRELRQSLLSSGWVYLRPDSLQIQIHDRGEALQCSFGINAGKPASPMGNPDKLSDPAASLKAPAWSKTIRAPAARNFRGWAGFRHTRVCRIAPRALDLALNIWK
jgi:hypothetical protein